MAPLARGSVVLCFALYKTEAQDGGPHTELKNKLCVTNSTARLVNGVPWAAEGVRHCTTTQGTRGGAWSHGRRRAASERPELEKTLGRRTPVCLRLEHRPAGAGYGEPRSGSKASLSCPVSRQSPAHQESRLTRTQVLGRRLDR